MNTVENGCKMHDAGLVELRVGLRHGAFAPRCPPRRARHRPGGLRWALEAHGAGVQRLGLREARSLGAATHGAAARVRTQLLSGVLHVRIQEKVGVRTHFLSTSLAFIMLFLMLLDVLPMILWVDPVPACWQCEAAIATAADLSTFDDQALANTAAVPAYRTTTEEPGTTYYTILYLFKSN